jgi:hypothetical protein
MVARMSKTKAKLRKCLFAWRIIQPRPPGFEKIKYHRSNLKAGFSIFFQVIHLFRLSFLIFHLRTGNHDDDFIASPIIILSLIYLIYNMG